MSKSKTAFTMIELIFVIIILGMLSAIALPKLVATRDDAYITKNIEYMLSAMTEISTYIVAKNIITDDLTQMSPVLNSLNEKGLVSINEDAKSVTIKIGEEEECFTILIDSNDSSELLKTSFSPSEDRICYQVQQSMKEKKYTIILRGKLINY